MRRIQFLRQSPSPIKPAPAVHRSFHASGTRAATPVPHPPAPGPPPKPPVASPTFEGDRVARKRKQAGLLKLGEQLKANPAKPSTALQKRFWKNVSVRENADGDFEIHLDSRPVRTPSRKALTIPKEKPHLATAIALEWDSLVTAQQALKQHYIPLTSLTSRALDIADADRDGNTILRENLVKSMLSYLRTDTLLCWVPEKNMRDRDSIAEQMEGAAPGVALASQDSLRSRQMRVAKPIIAHLTTSVWPGVEINPVLDEESIVPKPQKEMTTQVVHGWLSGLPAFELAGLERAVLASKSLCVAARLLVQWSKEFDAGKARPVGQVMGDAQAGEASLAETSKGRFDIEDAAEACTQEVIWQTQMWGEVEDTHDVDKEDVRRQLGSVVLLVHG